LGETRQHPIQCRLPPPGCRHPDRPSPLGHGLTVSSARHERKLYAQHRGFMFYATRRF
jgi:hypothetical protein